MPLRGPCLKRPLRKVILRRWSGWVHFLKAGEGGPQDSSAAKAYYEKAAALGNEDAKAALKRAECPYVIKDKNGKFVTSLCF